MPADADLTNEWNFPRPSCADRNEPKRRVRLYWTPRLACSLVSGQHGATVDQIAESADVSKTNLFYYFASKEDIYIAVLERLLDEWLAPFRASEIDSDPT